MKPVASKGISWDLRPGDLSRLKLDSLGNSLGAQTA